MLTPCISIYLSVGWWLNTNQRLNCQPLLPQSIRENNMNLNYYGLKLSRIGADFGFIGTSVGNLDNAMNNNFVGPFTSGFQTYNSTNANGGGAFIPTFYDHPDPTIDATASNPVNNGTNVISPFMGVIETKTFQSAYRYNWCGMPNTIVMPGGAGSINADELAKLKAVAEEEVSYPAFSDAGKWMDEKALYEKLDKEAALKAAATELEAFYDEKSDEDLGAIREAEAKAEEIAATEISDQALYDLKMVEWNDKIVQIPTSNVYAEKTRFVYSIAKKLYETQPEQLEENEAQNVNWLSEQCPYLFGPAVYKARVLRGLWEDGIDYNDKVICQTQGYFKTDNGTATDEDLPAKPVVEGEAMLLCNPVPATAPFKFSLPENSTATLQIYNNMGQLVKTENFTFNTALVNLDVQALATGLYHLRFTGSNGFVKSIDFIKK